VAQPAIRAEGLSKRYRIGERHLRYRTLRDSLAGSLASAWRGTRADPSASETRREIWALRDATFTVERGTVLGLIGANGAGKSTLLKLLCRITEPTAGSARLEGRVGSLLEVGTGFHGELTGRENIFMSGAVLGMRRAEIERKLEQMIAFAGVETFVDTPVKHYSSGMYLRLAFAVAAHLEPEILLVDEVLAVGDVAFQRKCLGKLSDIAGEGRTVILVSHNLAAVERLCDRAIVLAGGRLTYEGTAREAIGKYLEQPQREDAWDERRPGHGRLRFTRLRTLCDQLEGPSLLAGGDVELLLDYRLVTEAPLHNVRVRVGFTNLLGEPVFACCNDWSGNRFAELPGPEGTICLSIPRLPLNDGTYKVSAWLKSGGDLEDLLSDALEVSVTGGDFFRTGAAVPSDAGPCLVAHTFRLRPSDEIASSKPVLGVGARG
jgi:lipopolysaccharide transport system ATP-binding protein